MLDDFCKDCCNEGCKKLSDEFREYKVLVCKALSQDEEDDIHPFYPYCDDKYE